MGDVMQVGDRVKFDPPEWNSAAYGVIQAIDEEQAEGQALVKLDGGNVYVMVPQKALTVTDEQASVDNE